MGKDVPLSKTIFWTQGWGKWCISLTIIVLQEHRVHIKFNIAKTKTKRKSTGISFFIFPSPHWATQRMSVREVGWPGNETKRRCEPQQFELHGFPFAETTASPVLGKKNPCKNLVLLRVPHKNQEVWCDLGQKYRILIVVELVSHVRLLCDSMDCGPPGSSVHGILQERILEWVGMPSSKRSSRPRDQTQGSWLAGRFFTTKPLGKPKVEGGREQIWSLRV